MSRSRPGGRRAGGSLTRGEDFRAVYNAGGRFTSSVATVYVLLRSSSEVRLGVAAGRKIGGAVARNRIRRRIREVLGRLRPRLAQGVDVVVVPRASADRASFGELVSSISAALEKAGVLKNPMGCNSD